MTDRLYTNEEVENISRKINEVEELINGLFRGITFYDTQTQLAFNNLKTQLKENIQNIKQQLNIKSDIKIMKNIPNIKIEYDKLKTNFKQAINKCNEQSKKLNIEDIKNIDNYINNDLSVIIHINNRVYGSINIDNIKTSLQTYSTKFTNKLNTFKKCKKEINKIVKQHCNTKYDISFMFDVIPNLDMCQGEKEQIDIKSKIKTLFKEANNLKQKRKYLNALIYIEYLKRFNKICENVSGFVNNSSFNKGVYEQIKKLSIENIETLNNELDRVINEKVNQLLMV